MTPVMNAVNDKSFVDKKSQLVYLKDDHFKTALDRINKVAENKVGFRSED